MGCRTQFCIGGGCVPTSTDVAAWMSAFGYTYDASDPLASTYTAFVNEAPNGLSSQLAWKAMCEASMRSRAVLFCNTTAGDVTVTSERNLLGSVGVATQQAATGVAQLIAGASQAIPLIGAAIGDIFSEALSIVQAHAQAEKAQSNALSKLCPYATEAIQKADAAVFSGQATAEQALQFLSSTFASIKSSWASLEHSCNAFCWYNSVLDGIYAASQVLYGYAPSPAINNEDSVASVSASYESPVTALTSGGGTSGSGSLLIVAGIAVVVTLVAFAGRAK